MKEKEKQNHYGRFSEFIINVPVIYMICFNIYDMFYKRKAISRALYNNYCLKESYGDAALIAK